MSLKVVDGEFKGKSALAASAAEFLLMQVGGGMEVGWGKVKPADVYSLLQMQAYNWYTTLHCSALHCMASIYF